MPDDWIAVSCSSAEIESRSAEVDGLSAESASWSAEIASKSAEVALCKKETGWVCGMRCLLSETEKARAMAGFFFFYSISSEYHVGRINWPKMIGCKWLAITESYFG
jgi:hypothetical protein